MGESCGFVLRSRESASQSQPRGPTSHNKRATQSGNGALHRHHRRIESTTDKH